jgi:hypothetical protein
MLLIVFMHSAAVNFALRASAIRPFQPLRLARYGHYLAARLLFKLSRGPRNRTDYTHAECPSFREFSIPSIHFLNAKTRNLGPSVAQALA